MKIKRYVSLFVVLGSLLLLAACGSSGGSGGDQTASPAEDLGSDVPTGIDYVGAATCIGCHEDFSWSDKVVEDYLAGAHVVHSSHITQADAADGCLDCHDPIGDGTGMESLIDAANVPAGGLAAVGCENCHGAGGDHYGVGPMPVARPDAASCGSCHSELEPGHLVHHPEANTIAADYLSSPHARSINEHTYAEGSDTEVRALCSKCHTDEGAKLYKYIQGDTSAMRSLDSNPAVTGATPVQCRTCHDAHNPQQLLLGAVNGYDGNIAESAEYRTCTNCHQTETAYHDPATNPYGALGEIITDTHFRKVDDNDTPDDDTDDIVEVEGYNIDPANERACSDCHNVHSADVTIAEQWSASGHGDATGEAWVHYDWDAGNRQSCQECHTSTGIHNYLKDPAGYDAANNDFSHLSGWAVDDEGVVTSSGQNELLYCTGCHSNNVGGLLDPGALTMSYTYNSAAVILPDLGNSNVCIHCHGGRNNVDNINDASRSSRFEGHHGPAAGTLFSATTHLGYEYANQDYTDKSYFAHAAIGTVDADGNEVKAGTGTSGPCAACHMSESDHTYAVVSADPDTQELVINSLDTCAACHNTTDRAGAHYFDASVLEEEKLGFENAITLLAAYVTNETTNAIGTNITEEYSSVAIEYYGAFQNYKYMDDEPGAYAHNRYYAKRLIFDSIDWLDNGVLDGVITIDAVIDADAARWLGAATVADATVVPPVAIGDAKRP